MSNKEKMQLDAKSNHIFYVSNFERRVPLFDPGIEFSIYSHFSPPYYLYFYNGGLEVETSFLVQFIWHCKVPAIFKKPF